MDFPERVHGIWQFNKVPNPPEVLRAPDRRRTKFPFRLRHIPAQVLKSRKCFDSD